MLPAADEKLELEVNCPICVTATMLPAAKSYVTSTSKSSKVGEQMVAEACALGVYLSGRKLESTRQIARIERTRRTKRQLG